MICACKPEESIRVLGPLGTGFDAGDAACVYFVGGGVGVAPICGAMDALCDEGKPCILRFPHSGACLWHDAGPLRCDGGQR